MDHDQRTRALLENASWVRALARQLLSDEGLAEDVAQEALVVALDRPPASQTASGIRNWLRSVTRNLAFQVLRREAVRKSVEAAAARSEISYDSWERALLQQSLARAVLALDEIYRDVVVLRYFDDLAPIEIARRLNLPAATVRKRLSRAHKRLAELLPDELDGKDPRRALALLAQPAARPWPALPLTLAALALTALFAGAFALRRGAAPTTTTVRVEAERGFALVDGRVFQLDGTGARELAPEGEGDFHGVDPDLGPLVVVAPNRAPVIFEPPRGDQPSTLALPPRSWVFGSLYIDRVPPDAPLDMRLVVELSSAELETLAPLFQRGALERPGAGLGGDLVLRARTGDRGVFAFGGLEADAPVRLLLPPDLRLTFHAAGAPLEDGTGVRLTPSPDLIWFGAFPRER